MEHEWQQVCRHHRAKLDRLRHRESMQRSAARAPELMTSSSLKQDMTVLHALSAPSRFHDAHFCYFPLDAADPSQREYMFVACEDGKTRIFDVTKASAPGPEAEEDEEMPLLEPIAMLTGHANR